MTRTNDHRRLNVQAAPPAGGARALAILLVLAAFLVAPFIAAAANAQNPSTPHIAQVVFNSKINKRCPKRSLPGQPNACASWSVLVAGLDNRGVAPARIVQRSSIAPLYEVTLATQCCGAPPDRPPRFTA